MQTYYPENMILDGSQDKSKRNIGVYNISQLMQLTGRDQEGRLQHWGYEHPMFYLTISQRNEIFKLSSPVLGIVSSRMNRIAALDFSIVPIKKREDELVEKFKGLYEIYTEFASQMDLKYVVSRARIVQELQKYLPALLPDLSNFNNCLLRWKKDLDFIKANQTEQIKDWLMEPNQGVSWSKYIKKYIYNLMIHGANATYKQTQNKRLENFDVMLGGTVYQLRSPYFSTTEIYAQLAMGFEPQIFFSNEISYTEYLPVSTQSYPIIPLEALINKISEGLLYDKKMANEADDTRPPQKLLVITKNPSMVTGFDGEEGEIPLETDEQKRIESKINENMKHGILTFSGNNATIVDLTTAGTMELQNTRQKDIREEVAIVFNMSNLEINLTGSGDISGRQTAEMQTEVEEGKGIAPIKKLIAEDITKNIIPFRFGFGYMLEFDRMKNALREVDLTLKRQQAGLETINESREKEGLKVFSDEQYNKPKGVGVQPGQDNLNPLYTHDTE